jgi:hypothetical protein
MSLDRAAFSNRFALVPFIHYSTKQNARRAQRTWFLGAAQFAVLGRILSAAPQAGFGATISDVIATAMGYLGVEAGNAAEDPPRSDYFRATRARRRNLPVSGLGDTALEKTAAEFADSAGYSAAYLAAFVRAVERSQMADEVGAREAVEQRIAEADSYAHRAERALRRTSEREYPLVQALLANDFLREAARGEFRGQEGRDLIETPYWEKLSRKVRDLFAEARLDPRLLASYWNDEFPEDPVGVSATTLLEAGETSQTLAAGLRDWGPSPQKPPTPNLLEP